MSTKFTPGPWRIGNAGKAVFHPKGSVKLVADCATFENARENAALISASPDLYAAVEALIVERNYYAQRLAEETGITMSDHSGLEHGIFALNKANGK